MGGTACLLFASVLKSANKLIFVFPCLSALPTSPVSYASKYKETYDDVAHFSPFAVGMHIVLMFVFLGKGLTLEGAEDGRYLQVLESTSMFH